MADCLMQALHDKYMQMFNLANAASGAAERMLITRELPAPAA
jgi:hypothetical protein